MPIRTLSKIAAAAGAACALAAPALAEPISRFHVPGVRYDSSVTKPEEAFGYELGERPVRYGDMVAYLRDLAEDSDRIAVETLGYTHERRPILQFVVTSPENHADLDGLRAAHLQRRLGEAAPDAAPAVVWINFGVHGAESSSMDAAIPFLHHFAAGQGDAVDAMLDETIVVAAVVLNPDGHARRIDHVETFGSYTDVTDPFHEIHQLWIEARTNHYWFDLNRQWLPATQPEAQAWVSAWQSWKPHVSLDYHEMGSDSPYYFHPGESNRLNPLIPERSRELALAISERLSAWMDSEALLYATEEVFDNFYVGKGSTYPQVNGSIGILFEAGAARGGSIESERGLVEHADNIDKHFNTALASIRGAIELKDDLVAYQREFFAEAEQEGASDRRRAFVFSAGDDASRAARFVELLRRHDVDVYETARDVTADGTTFQAGQSYVVPLAQDQFRMIRAMFDRFTEFDETIFYDVSGWTLPLVFDLDYAALGAGGFSSNLLGDLAEGEAPAGAAPRQAEYGYVFDWADSQAPRALAHILQEDLLARAATEPFSVETDDGVVAMGRGAVFVPLEGQEESPARVHAIVRAAAEDAGVTIHAVDSGRTPEAGRDLGAWTVFEALQEPKVLLPFDGGFSRYDAGEVWWTLDARMGLPVTMQQPEDLSRIDTSQYTHMVLVGGRIPFDEDQAEAIKEWVSEGGVLIAHTEAADWAQTHILGREAEDEDAGGEGDPTARPRYDFEELRLRDAEHVIGGALFAGDLDPTHPLGFGFLDRDITLHRNATFTLVAPEEDPFSEVVRYADEPLLSGYASDRRLGEIAGTPAVLAQEHGRGAVILMADNPVFRGMYAGTERLLTNAIFFGGFVDSPRGPYQD